MNAEEKSIETTEIHNYEVGTILKRENTLVKSGNYIIILEKVFSKISEKSVRLTQYKTRTLPDAYTYENTPKIIWIPKDVLEDKKTWTRVSIQ